MFSLRIVHWWFFFRNCLNSDNLLNVDKTKNISCNVEINVTYQIMFISHLRRFLNSYDNAERTKLSNLENNWSINSNGESLKLYATKLRPQYFKHHIVLKLSIRSFYHSTIYFDYKLVNIDRNDFTYLFQNNWRYNNNFDT